MSRVAGSVGRGAPRGRRNKLLSLWGLRFSTGCACGAFVSPLSEHVSPSIELQPVACSGSNSGGTTRAPGGGSAFPSTPMALKVGALCVVLALVLRRIAVVGMVFRRWCWGRGFTGHTGLQTHMRTAARRP